MYKGLYAQGTCAAHVQRQDLGKEMDVWLPHLGALPMDITRCIGTYDFSRVACNTCDRYTEAARQHETPQQQHQPEQQPASTVRLTQQTQTHRWQAPQCHK
jgi:hypothetical protein